MASWIVSLGASCHTATKNWAFWRLPPLNQFSLVTRMGLTAVCLYVPVFSVCQRENEKKKNIEREK
jgi:hypothetical protein